MVTSCLGRLATSSNLGGDRGRDSDRDRDRVPTAPSMERSRACGRVPPGRGTCQLALALSRFGARTERALRPPPASIPEAAICKARD